MGILHTKKCAKVLQRANIPLFLYGAHGIGKTSAFYQQYLEGAEEAGSAPISNDNFLKIVGDADHKSLSSIDAKSVMREQGDLSKFGFWSVSVPNLSIEEMIGMPHIDDRGKVYRDTYLESQHVAATLMSASPLKEIDIKTVAILEKVTADIFASNCLKLGITEQDKNDVVLRYLRMHALMPDPRHTGGGIWLIDEMNRGFIEVEKAMMQLLLERVYLDYKVPDNVWMVTTMNPGGGEYQVRDMDPATLDRGCVLTMKQDTKEWLDWASNRGLGETTRLFADKHSAMVNKADEDFDQNSIQVGGTSRSLEYIDRAYAVMTNAEVTEVGQTIANGFLGREAGTVYHKEVTSNLHRPLTVSEIVDDYGWSSKMSDDEAKDWKSWNRNKKARKRLLKMVNKTNVKTELLNITLQELAKWFSTMGEELTERGGTRDVSKHTDEENGKIMNALVFLHDIPVDLSRNFIVEMLNPSHYGVMLGGKIGKYPVHTDLFSVVEEKYKEAVNE